MRTSSRPGIGSMQETSLRCDPRAACCVSPGVAAPGMAAPALTPGMRVGTGRAGPTTAVLGGGTGAGAGTATGTGAACACASATPPLRHCGPGTGSCARVVVVPAPISPPSMGPKPSMTLSASPAVTPRNTQGEGTHPARRDSVLPSPACPECPVSQPPSPLTRVVLRALPQRPGAPIVPAHGAPRALRRRRAPTAHAPRSWHWVPRFPGPLQAPVPRLVRSAPAQVLALAEPAAGVGWAPHQAAAWHVVALGPAVALRHPLCDLGLRRRDALLIVPTHHAVAVTTSGSSMLCASWLHPHSASSVLPTSTPPSPSLQLALISSLCRMRSSRDSPFVVSTPATTPGPSAPECGGSGASLQAWRARVLPAPPIYTATKHCSPLPVIQTHDSRHTPSTTRPGPTQGRPLISSHPRSPAPLRAVISRERSAAAVSAALERRAGVSRHSMRGPSGGRCGVTSPGLSAPDIRGQGPDARLGSGRRAQLVSRRVPCTSRLCLRCPGRGVCTTAGARAMSDATRPQRRSGRPKLTERQGTMWVSSDMARHA